MAPLREFDEGAAKCLQTMIFNDLPKKHTKWMQLLADPVFDAKFDMPLSQMRDMAYAQIKKVTEANLVSIFDF